MISKLLAAFLLLTASAAADNTNERANLIGKWESGTADGTGWTIEDKSDTLHLTYLEKGRSEAEFDCNTMGRECEAKESGKDAKVSMWYSGPKLVQMETRGSNVVKRRFSVPEAGDVLEVEVIPIVPGGKPETVRFKRAQVSSAAR